MTTIDKIHEILKSIKDQSGKLCCLLCSDDVVCWMTDSKDNIGKKIDGELAHTALLEEILEWNDTESVYLRTPIDSLKYEIEVEKMLKKDCEDGIIFRRKKIEELEKELKEMEKNNKKKEN